MEFEQFVGRNMKILRDRKVSDVTLHLGNESAGAKSLFIEPPIADNDNSMDINNKFKSANKIYWIQPRLESIPFDFCQNTSLHGLKYISQSQRHLSERIFWIVMFIIGLSTAVYLISDVWRKYNESPVIVSFDIYETSIENVPFPAITICNNNKLLKSRAEYFENMLEQNMDDDEALESIYYLTQVCLSSKSFTNKFGYSLFEYNSTLTEKAFSKFQKDENQQAEIQEFLRDNSQTCSDMIPLCVFQDSVINCTQVFNPIITDFGKCCTFNMVPNILRDSNTTYQVSQQEAEDWEHADLSHSGLIIDNMLAASINKSKYPMRQSRAGKSYGLSFVLAPAIHEYYCTNSDSYGFKLSMHLSAEIPNSIDFGYGIEPNSEVSLSMKPEITKAADDIRDYPLTKRHCYLENEKSLQFYKNYTVSNCQDECVANAVFKSCSCVRFYMPRNSTQPLCKTDQFTCTDNAKSDISKIGLKLQCAECLPLCTEISFSAQSTSAPLQPGIWRTQNSSSLVYWANDNVSIVHVYFDQDLLYARLRKELFGFTDLVANTGGLMGLCLGFSVLSAVELIYFITLRKLCQRQRNESIRTKVVQLWKNSKAKAQQQRNKNKSKALFLPVIETITTTNQRPRNDSSSLDYSLRDNNFNRTSVSKNEVTNFPLQLSVLDLLSRNHVNNTGNSSIENRNENYYKNQYWMEP